MKARQLVAVICLLGWTLYGGFAVVDGAVWTPHHIAGLVILIPSFCLWAVARRQLGSSFTVGAEARQLVTHGLYARIRHPIYVFGGLFAVGLLVFIGKPVLLLVPVLIAPLQILRIRREERVLEAAFGDAYRSYKQHTWF